MKKRLYRSEKDRKLTGVCGGVAEYFGIDPTLVRLGMAIVSCFWGTGIIVYIVSSFIIPNESEIKPGE